MSLNSEEVPIIFRVEVQVGLILAAEEAQVSQMQVMMTSLRAKKKLVALPSNQQMSNFLTTSHRALDSQRRVMIALIGSLSIALMRLTTPMRAQVS